MRGLTNEPLFVDPALAGARLASPMRRILAFVVDAVVLVVPTVVVAFGAAAISLEATDARSARAIVRLWKAPPKSVMAQEAVRDLVPLLVRMEAAGVPKAVKAAVEGGDLNRAGEMMKDYTITFALNLAEGRDETRPLAHEARLEVKELIPGVARGVALLGVPAFYFVAFTRSRRGATPGKRLFGIRVARLDGERLTWLESLERFVGYVHIPGTMFLSVADLWRDPNRRLPHDRVVHSAVFRVRRREAFPPTQPASAVRAAEGRRVPPAGSGL